MFKYLAAASLVFLIGATAAEFVVLEQRNDPPAGFSSVGPAPADQILSLRLALTQSDIVGLQDTVYEISTPGNPRYGQYLTEDEVKQFVAPSADTASLVNGWLASNELTAAPASPAGDWISVNMTVSQANDLLAAEFLTFRNDGTNQTVVRTLSYSVPRALKTGIEWVHPTIIFPEARNGGFPSFINKTSSGTTGGRSVTPASVSPECRATSSWSPVCLQELYGIPSAPAKPVKNKFWVSGFDNDFANKRDLQAFLETFRPDMNPNTTFDFVSVDGGINNQLPAGGGIEANPDMQYAVGLTNGIPVTFISTGTLPNDRLTEMLDQANHLLSLEHPPNTVLNTQTPGLESQLSPQMAVSLCNAYAQLAARGVSYIVQTNLWGAGSVPLPGCKPFDAPFPASCPFVTAVGATQFDDDQTEETASESSGGGFSNFFRRPKYQDTAVAAYLRATNNTHTTAFNVSGRAVPDVSAVWFVPWIFDLGVVDFLSAVGYSATIFASTVALLTNERIAAGKPGLGFLNPLIYANPGAFNDMKTGSNPGCAGAAIGFNSTSGWDPVTGFGSPSYPKLHEICSKL
ncbi:Serine protease S53 [Mycena venus]|uniref:Serine protease S53 n=1 Tax=Mycena venus TaxID=2733690 RepID=A0A8H7CG31_9AGAR|nr:Serine protease S53 [Mycena venus]